jgi:hypothetical protein
MLTRLFADFKPKIQPVMGLRARSFTNSNSLVKQESSAMHEWGRNIQESWPKYIKESAMIPVTVVIN